MTLCISREIIPNRINHHPSILGIKTNRFHPQAHHPLIHKSNYFIFFHSKITFPLLLLLYLSFHFIVSSILIPTAPLTKGRPQRIKDSLINRIEMIPCSSGRDLISVHPFLFAMKSDFNYISHNSVALWVSGGELFLLVGFSAPPECNICIC